eukprot:2909816-Lingulodinium_polyedra.AAC.1
MAAVQLVPMLNAARRLTLRRLSTVTCRRGNRAVKHGMSQCQTSQRPTWHVSTWGRGTGHSNTRVVAVATSQ